MLKEETLAQLFKFYDAKTYAELVEAQQGDIVRLQEKLNRQEREFNVKQPRE
ncbi:MAG: hypothetical protein KAS93_06665 [Gammaproteobacteria bacterium]|nr:hypothetical protein [Gammaproteobacteria bacterium]